MPTQHPAKNPFGPSQTRLFKYILTHPGCTAAQIREDEFPDKNGNYVWNLLRENTNLIEKREIGTDLPDEYRMKVNSLGAFIDVLHYVKTGLFKAKYVQATLNFTQTS